MHVHAIVHMIWRGVVIRTWSNEKQVSSKFPHTQLSYSFTHSTCTYIMINPQYMYVQYLAMDSMNQITCESTLQHTPNMYVYCYNSLTCIRSLLYHVLPCVQTSGVSCVLCLSTHCWTVISSQKSLERISVLAYWLYMYMCMLPKRASPCATKCCTTCCYYQQRVVLQSKNASEHLPYIQHF